MKIFLTGASGIIDSAIVRELTVGRWEWCWGWRKRGVYRHVLKKNGKVSSGVLRGECMKDLEKDMVATMLY